MIKINNTYFIDTDMDYGYSNSWMGHEKYYYGLYKRKDDKTYSRIREYKDLDGLCNSLISKYRKGLLEDIEPREIVIFVNSMINSRKIKRERHVNMMEVTT